MLLLKPLVKAREKPCEAPAPDGFALNRDLLWWDGSRNLSGKWETNEELCVFNRKVSVRRAGRGRSTADLPLVGF